MKLRDIISVDEASYAGNLGAMEMFKFQKIATTEQKRRMKELLAKRRTRKFGTCCKKFWV